MIVTRAQWGARHAPGASLRGPLGEIVIHHEGWRRGVQPPDEEIAAMRAVESYHVHTRGFAGIGYSWCVFARGSIYEGRGWLRQGAHTREADRNRLAHGICLMGHGGQQPATAAQWAATAWLIAEGIRAGAVTPEPVISGHRDYAATACPGDLIYPELGRLHGITQGQEDPMALSDHDMDRIEGMIRRILGEAVGPGQRTWTGTVIATLDGLQATYNLIDTEVLVRLARVEAALGIAPPGDPGATQVLPPQ